MVQHLYRERLSLSYYEKKYIDEYPEFGLPHCFSPLINPILECFEMPISDASVIYY